MLEIGRSDDGNGDRLKRRGFLKRSGVLVGAGVTGFGAVTNLAGTARGSECPADAEDCTGDNTTKTRSDGLDRDVLLSQSLAVVYYGANGYLEADDAYLHEFEVMGHGATRFSYEDERWRRSHNANLQENGIEISAGDEIVPTGSRTLLGTGVPVDESVTASDVVVAGAEGVADVLIGKYSPSPVAKAFTALQLAASLYEATDGDGDREWTTLAETWTVNDLENRFGIGDTRTTDMTNYAHFNVKVPTDTDKYELGSTTVTVESFSEDDKGRTVDATVNYDVKNPPDDEGSYPI